MKLLLDQNLSPRLASRLDDLFPGTLHVRDVGLEAADDNIVWQFAMDNGFCITSKDADFHQISFLKGPPPKVVWIQRGNCSTTQIEQLLRSQSNAIMEFDVDAEAAFLALC